MVTSCLRLQGSAWSQVMASCPGCRQQLQECCLELQCLRLGLRRTLGRGRCLVWLQRSLRPWLRRESLVPAQWLLWWSLLAGAGLQCLHMAMSEGHHSKRGLSRHAVLSP